MYTPVNPSFTIYKWGVRGCSLHGRVFVMRITDLRDMISAVLRVDVKLEIKQTKQNSFESQNFICFSLFLFTYQMHM